MTRYGFVVAGCMALLPLLAADPPNTPNKALAAQVDKLIKELGDPDMGTRNRATQELEKAGTDVLPQLREALKKTSDAEVRRRLDLVIPALERDAALAPTRVTLSLKDKSAQDAAKELAGKAGYNVQIYNSGGNPTAHNITLEFKDTPFWEALDQICEAGGVCLQEGQYGGNSGNVTIGLQGGDTDRRTVYNHGPFRVTAKGFNYYKNVNFQGARAGKEIPVQRQETLAINLSVSVEPKSPLINATQPLITEAVDDLNQSMLPINTNDPSRMHQYYDYSPYKSYSRQVNANLLPSQGGKTLKLLKGTIPIQFVAAQRPRIVIENLLQVKKQTYREKTTELVLEETTQNAGQVMVRMSIKEQGIDGNRDYSWRNTLQQRMEVMDAKGNKYQCYGQSEGGGNGNTFTGTWIFGQNGPAIGPPTKFVYYEWTTMNHSVPFEFKDLPLP